MDRALDYFDSVAYGRPDFENHWPKRSINNRLVIDQSIAIDTFDMLSISVVFFNKICYEEICSFFTLYAHT